MNNAFIRITTTQQMISFISALQEENAIERKWYSENLKNYDSMKNEVLKHMFHTVVKIYDYDHDHMLLMFNFSTQSYIDNLEKSIQMYVSPSIFNILTILKNYLEDKTKYYASK